MSDMAPTAEKHNSLSPPADIWRKTRLRTDASLQQREQQPHAYPDLTANQTDVFAATPWTESRTASPPPTFFQPLLQKRKDDTIGKRPASSYIPSSPDDSTLEKSPKPTFSRRNEVTSSPPCAGRQRPSSCNVRPHQKNSHSAESGTTTKVVFGEAHERALSIRSISWDQKLKSHLTRDEYCDSINSCETDPAEVSDASAKAWEQVALNESLHGDIASVHNFSRLLKKQKIVQPCLSERAADALFDLIDAESDEEVQNAALVSICRYVFPDHIRSPAHAKLLKPELVGRLLETAKQKRLNICTPIDFSCLELGSVMCRGSGGTILQGFYKNEPVIIKKMCPDDIMFDPQAFHIESTIMTLFHNKHLLRCLAASEHGSEHLMLLPRYDCSLDQKCAELHASSMDRQLLVCLLMKMLIAVCEGLQSLHSRAVIHRDLKPQNVLVKEKRPGVEHTYDVVVADFGTSRTFSRETKFMTQNVGTGRYQAPEVIEGNQYNSAADIFSFAILAYETLTGRRAFSDRQCPFYSHLIISGERPQFSPDDRELLPGSLINLIELCWAHDAIERPDMDHVLAMIIPLCSEMERAMKSGNWLTCGPPPWKRSTLKAHRNSEAALKFGLKRASRTDERSPS